ncbi:hypothetical protein EUGRSUZ_E01684 [Eucalyptus grandis]|uniref:Uncharacterized protein n=2 Tax=Eucalyptus grandis TaxID=71139 RepID=A0ACC3KUN8_EUCGR|nr:hypothetical protein EUGRSUZ_E01684 [Eucalyptus grandis]
MKSQPASQEETALQLAIKNDWFDAVVLLVENLKQHKKEKLTNWKDNKGNTVLHLAIDGEQATSAPQSPSRLPSKKLKREKESMGDIRNVLLVVAVLIASTTYQAVLQPPSFITEVDNTSTKGFQGYYASWITSPLGRDFAYVVFMSGNTFGFLMSVHMIICLTRDLPFRLPLLLSVTAMVQTYYCFTYYLPFTLMNKLFGLKNVELLSMLPIMTFFNGKAFSV